MRRTARPSSASRRDASASSQRCSTSIASVTTRSSLSLGGSAGSRATCRDGGGGNWGWEEPPAAPARGAPARRWTRWPLRSGYSGWVSLSESQEYMRTITEKSVGITFFLITVCIWIAGLRSPLVGGSIILMVIIGLLALVFYWRDVKAIRKADMHVIDRMSGIEFEQYLAQLYHCLGYNVKLTPPNNDQGVDLILKRDGECIVVQAKRWDHPVGISAVQEVVASMAPNKAHSAMVITSNYFTPQAEDLADKNNVRLIDRSGLAMLKLRVLRRADGSLPAGIPEVEKSNGGEGIAPASDGAEQKRCPKCDKPLVPRVSKHGPFVYCSAYPRCRYKRNVPTVSP